MRPKEDEVGLLLAIYIVLKFFNFVAKTHLVWFWMVGAGDDGIAVD